MSGDSADRVWSLLSPVTPVLEPLGTDLGRFLCFVKENAVVVSVDISISAAAASRWAAEYIAVNGAMSMPAERILLLVSGVEGPAVLLLFRFIDTAEPLRLV